MARAAKVLPAPAKTQGFVQVVKGVYAYIGGNGATNFGLALTKDRPVIIDNDIRVRKPFLAGMRSLTRKMPGLVLNTHHNFDHTSDNGFYHGHGAVSFGCELTAEEMEREEKAGVWVKQMVGRGPKVDHLVGKLHVAPPMVTFEEMITVRYGGRAFQMIYIDHCHTLGDTVVWMPEERVLFSGDLLTHRTLPVNRLGNFANWIAALDVLDMFPVRRIVPGHGPLPPAGKGIIKENRDCLLRLRERAQAALRKAKAPEKAAQLVQMPEYRRWFRYGNVGVNALKMAQELKGKRK
ncbi:MAG: MBL fold metallo-hydrolase [Candidatus Tectomicrobia bacterium]|uniref:MBL fold metallo-hydrolase n=1 Tax=Tectimicrobiota bacterium TaxID=2528274 RepID=A0A932HYY4_UNCTE|nr:MBL fold metallo-hydrolase [Candidatus Tectomicrobia bacterium]